MLPLYTSLKDLIPACNIAVKLCLVTRSLDSMGRRPTSLVLGTRGAVSTLFRLKSHIQQLSLTMGAGPLGQRQQTSPTSCWTALTASSSALRRCAASTLYKR